MAIDDKNTESEILYLERYEKLNDRQKEAVNTIYGAVMVIAGPGTGKTEVLAMRIANLMRSEAQVQPQEILCLTYTDEATNSMRRRLTQIAGPIAHKINIHTFHSFCNMVIQNHPELFSKKEMQPIDDLERAELMHNLLNELPKGNPLRKLSGDIYSDTKKLGNLFSLMKREHYTHQHICSAVDAYIASLPERDEYIYKRKYRDFKAGDLKQDQIDKESERVLVTKAAAELFPVFQQKMQELGRYDFDDMILWVLSAFEEHPWLLQIYQERFQYILVDEFQDTNGAQNELLTFLSSYWDNPNIFVVGDDDQSIFEFQGARIRNIIDFYNRYKEDISIIVLPHNYRSSQAVIDAAMAAINNNQIRLIAQLSELNLDKNIIAANDRFANGNDTILPEIRTYQNPLQEAADIVLRIEELRSKGVPLRDIAIIYSKHKQADALIDIMERRGVAYNVRKKVNILHLPIIEQLINVLRYIDRERRTKFDAEDLLFELMHAPYFGIDANDIALLALHLQHHTKGNNIIKWRLALSNPLMIESLNLSTGKAMYRLGRHLDNWEQQQLALPLPLLIEKIMHESGLINHILQTVDHVYQLQVLNTFFEFVQATHERNPKIRCNTFLQVIDRMHIEGIELPLNKVVQSENGVFCYTAHSSKGNEFEYVFLIGCNKDQWEDKRGSNHNYALPDTLTHTEEDQDKSYKTEGARRLFYVALTRAKKHLFVSYSIADNKGKALSPSVFVEEISKQEDRKQIAVPEHVVAQYLNLSLQPVPTVRIKISNGEWIERLLQQFTMSATQLNKFLRCPLTFYYETILRVPMQKGVSLAFGSAVHYALERLYLDMKENGDFPTKEQFIQFFIKQLYRESANLTKEDLERRLEKGEQMLAEYYDYYIDNMPRNVEIELSVKRYYLHGVPVTGKIDKIEKSEHGCIIVDYKTGKPGQYASKNLAPPSDKDPIGGDYWRQMIFYKLLLENSEQSLGTVNKGLFDYIEKNEKGEHKIFTVPFIPSEEDVVLSQLKDAYTRIMNHEFDKGCGDENCHWCNFAKRYELVRTPTDYEMDDD